ncbi:MAG: sulfatase [Verrucomicrobiales bacterium]|nr:sulfatase [Verrucomicrobiales bacterium]
MNFPKTIRFLALIAWTIPPFASELDAAEPPNVLFISIDDLNDFVGCLDGHPQVKTPHIDALAESGVNFRNAHCQAPICNPSRVSMLLGKLPSTTGHYFLAPGFRDVEVTKEAKTMFQHFRENGYYASTRGKIFHRRADVASFDHIEPTAGWKRPPQKLRFTLPGSHPAWDWGEVDVPDEEQRDYKTAAWAAEQIPELAKKEEPYFLAVGFSLPHVPVYASEKWFDLYPLDSLEMPPAPEDDLDDVPEIAVQLSLNPTAPRDAWMKEHGEGIHFVRAYLAANSFIDSLVGMMLDSLENSGEAENTVVVLWSDHGFHLGEKKKWAKRSLWERTTRVPLIFAGPGIVEGANSNAPVGLIDVWPTLEELCGVPTAEGLEGRSLTPLLENPNSEWPYPALTTFGPNNHTLRSEHFRYSHYADGSEELYDHHNDSNEHTNLIPAGKHADVVEDFQQWIPTTNVDPVPGSSGSDSPLYGESDGLQNMKKEKPAK